MKTFFILSIFCFALKAEAQVSVQQGINLYSIEYFWKEAVEIYVTETEDYLDSMQTTEQELKQWRLRVLQDKFETRIGGLEVILSKSNMEELAQLEKSVELRGIDSLDDSLMMRLAQLHYDRANFDFNLKVKKIRENKGASGLMPTPDYKKTIYYANEIIKRFPKSSVLEHAYYLLGFCLFDENKDLKASKVYEELLKTFPTQPLSFEARWRLAEFYFEQAKYSEAKENYDFLIKHKNAFSQKATYKLGATFYALGKYNDALKVFLELYQAASEKLGTQDPEAETLYNEALDYLAYIKVKNIPLNVDDTTDSIVVQRLADIYKQKLNDSASRNVLIAYAKNNSFSKYAPKFLSSVMDSYEYDNLYASAQKVRALFLDTYKPSSEFWKKWSQDVNTTVEIQDLYESVLLSSAHYFADLSKKEKNSENYNKAVEHYTKFIDEYPVSPLRNQAKFEMAELQYFSGRYADAGATYMDMTIDTESDEYREEAAYGYFLSEMKRIKYNPAFSDFVNPDIDKAGALKPASDLSLEEKKFFEAADFYTKIVTKGFRRQKILYKKAELLFKHNQFKEARNNLELIFKDQELSTVAPRALRMMEETYNLEGDWKSVLETKKLQIDIARRQSFDLTQTEEIFKSKSVSLGQAWKSEKKGEIKDAAELYEYFTLKYAKAPEVPAALLRAGLLYRRLGQIPESNRLLFRLIKDYPTHQHASQAEFLESANLESMLDFDGALNGFNKIFKKYPKKEIGLQALLNAASLHYAKGDYKGAGSKYELYAKILGDDASLLTAAEVYKKAGDKSMALRIYKEFSRGGKGPGLAAEAYLNMAEISSTMEQKQEYCKAIKKIVGAPQIAKTASAQHAVTGCMYFKSKPYTQKVSLQKLEKNWQSLSQVYDYIMLSQDYTWLKEVAADLKALNVRTGFEPAHKKYLEIQNKLSENRIESFAISQLVSKDLEADTIFVRWPIESSLTRVAYDQKKWDELIKNAEIEITVKPRAYLYIAVARANAEKGDWANAKNNLRKCIAATKDAVCSAHLTLIDNSYNFEELNFEPEDEAVINLARAVKAARLGKDPRSLFQKTAQINPLLADTYKYYANYLIKLKNYDLAKVVLNAGIMNTQGDERLLLQKGYLALDQKNLEMVLSVFNEMNYYEAVSEDSVVYRAVFYYLSNKDTQAQKLLAQLNTNKENYNLLSKIINNKNRERLPAGEEK